MTITNNTKATLMRSRTAITAMLTSGLLLSGGGTALGISALQSTTNAGVAQYGTTGPGPGTVPTLGGTVTPPAAAVTPPPADEGQVASETSSSPKSSAPTDAKVSAVSPARTDPVQAARQVATVSGDSLPFTGYASIPVLLLGAALFTTGLVLRRRSAQL